MSKKILVGLVLAVVLFGGSISSALAADVNSPNCPSPLTRTTPQPMGSPGAY